jgi:hypothetical protein
MCALIPAHLKVEPGFQSAGQRQLRPGDAPHLQLVPSDAPHGEAHFPQCPSTRPVTPAVADRVITIRVATIAVGQRGRFVRFGAASEILDFFRLFKDGKRYRRFTVGFQRVFGATMFFGTNEEPYRELVLDWARFHFLGHLHFWFHKTEGQPTPSPQHENCAVLSEAFYHEIDHHRIPVEREVVAALANAPGVLDLYLWLVRRTCSLNNQTARIPLFAAGGLASLGLADILPTDSSVASFNIGYGKGKC